MYKVKSTGTSLLLGRGYIKYIHSPVISERTNEAFKEAAGNEIEIDGKVYEILAVEMFMPGGPLRVGESIGILIGFEE